MKRMLAAVLAASVLGTSLAASVAPAAADPRRDEYIKRWYLQNPRDDGYKRWERDRRGWRDRDYRDWYRRHHRDNNNDSAAAAIFGLAAGALASGLVTGTVQPRAAAPSGGVPSAGGYPYGSDGYYRYCSSKYRSFDPSSGTFLGYDGNRHYCR